MLEEVEQLILFELSVFLLHRPYDSRDGWVWSCGYRRQYIDVDVNKANSKSVPDFVSFFKFYSVTFDQPHCP